MIEAAFAALPLAAVVAQGPLVWDGDGSVVLPVPPQREV